jgi:hypothetical protein
MDNIALGDRYISKIKGFYLGDVNPGNIFFAKSETYTHIKGGKL